MPIVATIGLLHTGTEKSFIQFEDDLYSGLAAMGYWIGEPDYRLGYQQVEVMPTWAEDDQTALETNCAALLKAEVDIIVAAGGPQSAVVAREMTKENLKPPVVFTTVADPQESGLVDSYSKPKYNLTGMWGSTSELDAQRAVKLLDLLNMDSLLKGKKKKIRALTHAKRPKKEEQFKALQLAVPQAEIEEAEAANIDEVIQVLNLASDHHGLLVTADSLFNNHREEVVKNANKPAIYQWREFVEVGGLMSFGPNLREAYFTAGVYVGRILKKEEPAEMAVSVPVAYEFVVNLKTANALLKENQVDWLKQRADVLIDGRVTRPD